MTARSSGIQMKTPAQQHRYLDNLDAHPLGDTVDLGLDTPDATDKPLRPLFETQNIEPTKSSSPLTMWLSTHWQELFAGILVAIVLGVLGWLFKIQYAQNREVGEIHTSLRALSQKESDDAARAQKNTDRLDGRIDTLSSRQTTLEQRVYSKH